MSDTSTSAPVAAPSAPPPAPAPAPVPEGTPYPEGVQYLALKDVEYCEGTQLVVAVKAGEVFTPSPPTVHALHLAGVIGPSDHNYVPPAPEPEVVEPEPVAPVVETPPAAPVTGA